MKYMNITAEHELSSILCGRLVADSFIHAQRLIDIYVLIIVEKGVLCIEIDGERYKVRRGEYVIIPSDVMHTGFKDADGAVHLEYFWAHFSHEDGIEVSESRSGSFSVPIYGALPNYPRARILYNQLLDVHFLSGARKKCRDFLFTALLCEIASQYEYEGVSENKTVNRAAAWIELNINSPISLEQTAAALGYNKRYLSRIFRANTGMTVNEFIADKKFTLAKQLLTGSDESVTSIAASLGFFDAGYFMRAFKKREGVTCLEYRNAYSKMYLNRK